MIDSKALARYGGIALSVIALDQASKAWVVRMPAESIALIPGISLSPVYNKGISWGILHNYGDMPYISLLLIAGIATIIMTLAWYSIQRLHQSHWVVPEVLVIAGAVSNLIDRIWHGGVVDFIVLSWRDWVFPYFNIADMAIVLGVMAMLLYTMLHESP